VINSSVYPSIYAQARRLYVISAVLNAHRMAFVHCLAAQHQPEQPPPWTEYRRFGLTRRVCHPHEYARAGHHSTNQNSPHLGLSTKKFDLIRRVCNPHGYDARAGHHSEVKTGAQMSCVAHPALRQRWSAADCRRMRPMRKVVTVAAAAAAVNASKHLTAPMATMCHHNI
jgi:hypothetical protein